MADVIVKLQRFACWRRHDGQEAEAEAALWAAAEKHHGARWPELKRFYEIWHHDETPSRRFTALTSVYESVVLNG